MHGEDDRMDSRSRRVRLVKFVKRIIGCLYEFLKEIDPQRKQGNHKGEERRKIVEVVELS